MTSLEIQTIECILSTCIDHADAPGSSGATRRGTVAAGALLPALFSITLFASAFLLFSVQPMVSRMVLPRLGGSPSVWNTCVCFFEVTLLLGYLYADWSATRLGGRTQLVLHGAVLGCGMKLLPFSLGAAIPPSGASPTLWLLGQLSMALGLPFVAIAATAPLLQSWFARTSNSRARDPYFLYAASNAGSLLALLSYPLLIEPSLGLTHQASLWGAGFVTTAVLVLASGAVALANKGPVLERHVAARALPPPAIAVQLRWVALAFVPSALMLAVTTYITTDIAAAPLFWVLPLAIYILTFIVAFAGRPRVAPRWLLALQGCGLAAAGVAGMEDVPNLLSLCVALSAFTLTAFVCHTDLAALRPAPQHLTRYFLLISVGGALGGMFNAFAAPLLFRGPWEYPLLLVAASLLRPAAKAQNGLDRADLVYPFLLSLASFGLLLLARSHTSLSWTGLAVLVPFAVLVWFSRRPARLAGALAGLFLLPISTNATNTLASARSFFGIYRIRDIAAEHVLALQHGTTMHGLQSTLADEGGIPLGYYARSGAFGRFFAARERAGLGLRSVDVIGLGSGGLGCYARPGQMWSFREIDPTVEMLARDDRFFHFLRLCGNGPKVVLGDARVTLEADNAARYDLLVVDAFSSDSVPMHLLTREALSLYFARLNPGGVVLFHISNRYLSLAPVVANLARASGAPVRHLLTIPPPGVSGRFSAAELVAIGKPGASLDFLAEDGWDVPPPGPVLWTDERADILSVIRW